ncbi:methyl-accepting chemotaxis protein [Novimethylophilus kurashikiensis]|uniref:Methyl-accepting chemotaxis protein n=1 Tax=Novimethylophilus kurashikiensis TaxID=1825523 RepID=A0A2R5F2H3_9PROT|nr:methyl-accepting chemotaxis protein [Novimethylophilus kurashikiensis]GBG12806.1 methyl-accepting chemotaxis protein [Novimethylophilus kurashikiensis]
MQFIQRLNLKKQMILLAFVALSGFMTMTLLGVYAITYPFDLRTYWVIAAVLFLIGCAIMFSVAIYLGNHAGNRAYTIVKAMGSMAKGDLTNKVRLEGKDEFSWMAYEYDTARKSVATLLESVTETALSLAASAEQLSSITRQSLDRVNQQKERTDQVVSSMSVMSGMVQDVAQNASTASEAAESADREAQLGYEVVTRAGASIDILARDVEKSMQVIQLVENESRNIGTVMDVIKSIAEQTNLLALNAAIEAARAGEHGRGFAVVADEVRTLAQRTQKSTQEIQAMIERLQTESANAVRVMGEERDRAQESVREAESAGASLGSITQVVKTINEMNAKIATAACDQSAMAEEINRNMNVISEISDQTAGGANETASAAQNLADQASRLQDTVRKFKV